MKLITVTILILLVGVEFGFCQLQPYGKTLRTSYHRFCRPTSNVIYSANISPCYDTPGCELPVCCGIICDTSSRLTITYEARAPLSSTGEVKAQLGGVGYECANTKIGTIDKNYLVITPPAGWKDNVNVCNHTPCPQDLGKTYNLTLPFKFASPTYRHMSTIFNFVIDTSNDRGETVFCTGLYARVLERNYVMRAIRMQRGRK